MKKLTDFYNTIDKYGNQDYFNTNILIPFDHYMISYTSDFKINNDVIRFLNSEVSLRNYMWSKSQNNPAVEFKYLTNSEDLESIYQQDKIYNYFFFSKYYNQ